MSQYGQSTSSLTLLGQSLETTASALWAEFNEQYPNLGQHVRLGFILWRIGRWDVFNSFKDQGVSDLWFPLPKQTLRYFLKNTTAEKQFHELQQKLFHDDASWPNTEAGLMPHVIFEDGEEVIASDRTLGEGGFAIVEQITLPTVPLPTVCVRKRIGRPKQLKAQKQIFEAFTREIAVMSQVDHHHCVRFLGSYTDYDAVSILSLPVADMDLAAYLNQENLDEVQLVLLRRGIGCLCNGLLYLHQRKIRHEDLKPQNVLIHGNNLLLTDFGFSLDFSEDSVSTTTGRPTHWTARYSAPETMDHQARNRATDIWGLGCILIEMLSRLYGHRHSEMTTFWKQTGNGHPSFSMNTEATNLWLRSLSSKIGDDQKDRMLFICISTMLRTDRLLRPSAQQVLNKLADLEALFPSYPSVFGSCCKYQANVSAKTALLQGYPTRSPGHFYPHAFDKFTYILADLDLTVFAKKGEDPAFPGQNTSLLYFFRESELGLIHKSLRTVACNATSRPDSLKGIRHYPTGVSHAVASLNTYSILDWPFNRLSCSVRVQTSNKSSFTEWHMVQFTLIQICFPNSEVHGKFFIMASWNLDCEEEPPIMRATSYPGQEWMPIFDEG